MVDMPAALAAFVDEMESITDRNERAELLIEIADRFDRVRVPADIAVKPYAENHRAPACESEAFVWAVDRPDGTLAYWFDVLNPQGLSAMAMAVILAEHLYGQPPEAIIAVPSDIMFRIFGRELSMGKGAGLLGILTLVQAEARRRLA